MRNDEMERWRLGEIERELLEIAARARASTAEHAAALMAEIKRIEEHCAHCKTPQKDPAQLGNRAHAHFF